MSGTEIYTLSLHDALPICPVPDHADLAEGERDKHADDVEVEQLAHVRVERPDQQAGPGREDDDRSEEHASELQSQFHIVCRLLLEKKKLTLVAPLVYFDIR